MVKHKPPMAGWLVVDEPQGLYLADDTRSSLPVDLGLRRRLAGEITPAVPPVRDAPGYPIPPVLKVQIDRHLRFDALVRQWSHIEREAFSLPLTPAENLCFYGRAIVEVEYVQGSSTDLSDQLFALAFTNRGP